MEGEAQFSDFGDEVPASGRRTCRLGVASLVLGIASPLTCIGGVAMSARAFDDISFPTGIVSMLVPILVATAGLILGGLAIWLIVSRPHERRGVPWACAGIALNLMGGAASLLIATQIVRLGSIAGGSIDFALREITAGDADALSELFHERVRDRLTGGVLRAFDEAIRARLGSPLHGPRSVVELLSFSGSGAIEAARRAKGEDDLPALPYRFERGEALVMLRVDREAAAALTQDLFALKGRVSLRGLVTNIRIFDEHGQVASLLDDDAS